MTILSPGKADFASFALGVGFLVLFFLPLYAINTKRLPIKNAAWSIKPHKTYSAIKGTISVGNEIGLLSGI